MGEWEGCAMGRRPSGKCMLASSMSTGVLNLLLGNGPRVSLAYGGCGVV